MEKLIINICKLTLVCCFLSLSNAYAFEITRVSITNNTSHPLTLHSDLVTTDQAFCKGKDWDEFSQTIESYATKEILWFSRNAHVKQNVNYQYDVKISRDNLDSLHLIFNVKHKKVYGTGINAELYLPSIGQIPVLRQSHFEKFNFNFWNNHYEIYARNFLPLGETYTSYHFVINENAAKQVAPSNKELSILTYNTQLMPFYAEVVDRLNHPKIRAKDIPAFISHYDVVILEELFDHWLRSSITAQMQRFYPYVTNVVGKQGHNALTGGVVIFSKWPILKETQHVYRANSGLDSLSAKGVVYAMIDKQGQKFHIFGTHLQSGNSNDETRSRQQQFIELANFILGAQIPSDEPLIIGGDFNMTEVDLEKDNFLERLNLIKIKNIGYPYSCDPKLNTMNVGNNRVLLDYLFVGKNHLQPHIATNKVFILRDLNNVNMWPNFDLSDHFPVEGYFKF